MHAKEAIAHLKGKTFDIETLVGVGALADITFEHAVLRRDFELCEIIHDVFPTLTKKKIFCYVERLDQALADQELGKGVKRFLIAACFPGEERPVGLNWKELDFDLCKGELFVIHSYQLKGNSIRLNNFLVLTTDVHLYEEDFDRIYLSEQKDARTTCITLYPTEEDENG